MKLWLKTHLLTALLCLIATVASGQGVDIPSECRVPNRSGSQCVWCSVETMARFHGLQELYDLTSKYRSASSPGRPESILRAKGIRFRAQNPPNRDPAILKEAIAEGLPVGIGLTGTHMLTLVDYGPTEVKWIDNSNVRAGVRTIPRSVFDRRWDGWAIVIYPKERRSKRHVLPDQAPRPFQAPRFMPLADSWGQTVKLPAEVKVDVGRLASVPIEWTGSDVRWTVPTDLDAFREYDPDPAKVRLRLIGYKPGSYTLVAVAASKEGKLCDFVTCKITVDTPTPPPDPNPPGPGPAPTPPGPGPGPAPIPGTGLRVLIVYKTQDLGKLPRPQELILFHGGLRQYLDAHCAMGPDGKTHEWRIYDADVDASAESKTWQDAMKRPRQSVPWLIVARDGKTGFEGPLPATVDDTLALLKKFEGAGTHGSYWPPHRSTNTALPVRKEK